jgi:hypothetical protein
MTRVTIVTTIAASPSRPHVISFSTLLLLLLLVVIFYVSIIDKHTIFTTLLHQAWAFKPTNTTITQPSPTQLTVYIDKPSYVVGEDATFSGNIGKGQEGENVRIDIYDPNGRVFQNNLSTETDIDGAYSYLVTLQNYGGTTMTGEYTAMATYNKQNASTQFEVVPNYGDLQAIRTSDITISNITIDADKSTYVIGEDAQFGGTIGKGQEGKTVRIDIYDPNGRVFQNNLSTETDIDGAYSYLVTLQNYGGTTMTGEYTATATVDKQSAETKFNVIPVN